MVGHIVWWMHNQEAFYNLAAAMPLLTADEELALGRRAQRGDANAARTLVKHNIRLAHKAAAYYARRNRQVEEEDLIQAGIEGLCEAAKRYDPERGFRFSTYAMQWVNNRMRKYIEETHSRVMRVPQKISYAYFSGRMTPDERQAYERTHFGSLSLDVRVRSTAVGSDALLKDTITDDEPSLETRVADDDLRATVRRLITDGSLSAGQRAVIIRRYGLDGEPPERCRAMAKRIGVDESMIRSVCDSALDHLREALM